MELWVSMVTDKINSNILNILVTINIWVGLENKLMYMYFIDR